MTVIPFRIRELVNMGKVPHILYQKVLEYRGDFLLGNENMFVKKTIVRKALLCGR